MSEMNGLPSGWVATTIAKIAQTQTGGTPSRARPEFFGGDIPWVKSGELGDGIVYSTEETLTPAGLQTSAAKVFPKGTLCVALYGATVGKLGILGIDAATNQAICGIFLPPNVDTRYIYHFLYFRRAALIGQGKGGAQSNISNGLVRSTAIPLAPTQEQRRIVAKIEELFSDLDAGIAALERVRLNLKRYRAAVLKAAVEGRLTAKWRQKHPSTEPASKLLERILVERRQKWEQDQLAKFAAAGKPPPKDWREKYQQPAAPDSVNLPHLPPGWCWTTVDALLREPLRNGHSAKKSVTGTGVRTFTLTAVTYGDFSECNTKLTQAQPNQVADVWVQQNDILIERSNTPELVGTARMYRGPSNFAVFPDLLIRIRPVAAIQSSYAEIVLQSYPSRIFFRRRAKGIAGSMPKIDQETIERLPVPLPPIDEQALVVSEVERRLSIADAVEAGIETELGRSSRLRQSILKRAFDGKLVPQDAGDESASALLARISAGRQPQRAGANGRSRRSQTACGGGLFNGS